LPSVIQARYSDRIFIKSKKGQPSYTVVSLF
jgi:hypothetical protein